MAAEFESVDALYRSGAKLINISATGCVMKVVVKTMQEIVAQLNTILQIDKMITFDPIRKFILLQLHFCSLEIILYSAFNAPHDDFFYLGEDSKDWQLFTRNLEISHIENLPKYRKDVRFVLDRIMAGGATVFKS